MGKKKDKDKKKKKEKTAPKTQYRLTIKFDSTTKLDTPLYATIIANGRDDLVYKMARAISLFKDTPDNGDAVCTFGNLAIDMRFVLSMDFKIEMFTGATTTTTLGPVSTQILVGDAERLQQSY